jgi:hypothetical protein
MEDRARQGRRRLRVATGAATLVGALALALAAAGPASAALVTLPEGDSGHLPAAFGGNTVAWYGEASTGTFCGSDFAQFNQGASLNGCSSGQPNSGRLTSPQFSLAGLNSARLRFRSWFEIESVSPSGFDLMSIEYAADGGTDWLELPLGGDDVDGTLNPPPEEGGAPQFGHSNNGLRRTPSWQAYDVDLAPALGSSTVRIRFTFATGDTTYQGFRGWALDDIVVDSAAGIPAVLSEGFEQGLGSWTADGYWHARPNPHLVRVHDDIAGPLQQADQQQPPPPPPPPPVTQPVIAPQQTPALPPPVARKSFNLRPTRGRIMIRRPKTKTWVRLSGDGQMPMGTEIDARNGRVGLAAARDTKGAVQGGEFYGGVFKVTQTKGSQPITDLSLTGANPRRPVQRKKPSTARTSAFAAAKRKPKAKPRRLWGRASGRFRSKGNFSAATVRGTWWLVEDHCDYTLTRVRDGVVRVRDLTRRKTITLRKGKSYRAWAPRSRRC